MTLMRRPAARFQCFFKTCSSVRLDNSSAAGHAANWMIAAYKCESQASPPGAQWRSVVQWWRNEGASWRGAWSEGQGYSRLHIVHSSFRETGLAPGHTVDRSGRHSRMTWPA